MKNTILSCILIVFLSCSFVFASNTFHPIKIKLKNPTNLSRKDEVISVPVSSVKAASVGFDENFLAVKYKGKNLPYEIIKNEAGDNIVFQVSLLPREQKLIVLSWSKSKPNVKSGRTLAFLAMKKNYALKEGVYTGGNFESVDSVTVPKSHFPHDALYQMEGPSWESDMVAYRFYLDERNRTDIFGKSTNKIILDIVGKNDLLSGDESYEKPLWWGQDIFKVGNSLGIGSVAAFSDNKVVTVSQTDSIKCRVVNNSLFSSVISNHFGWNAGNEKVNIEANYSIFPGTRLTAVNAKTDKSFGNFCTGLAKHENTEFISVDNKGKWGYIGLWGKQTIINDNLGIALFYNTEEKLKLLDDQFSHVVVFKSGNSRINYYFAACWEKEKNGIKTFKDFQIFLNNTIESLNNPVIWHIQK